RPRTIRNARIMIPPRSGRGGPLRRGACPGRCPVAGCGDAWDERRDRLPGPRLPEGREVPDADLAVVSLIAPGADERVRVRREGHALDPPGVPPRAQALPAGREVPELDLGRGREVPPRRGQGLAVGGERQPQDVVAVSLKGEPLAPCAP